jgi:uncharacterized membrane protein
MWFVSALVLGFVAGLRSMTAPAAASWGAWLGILPVQNTPLAFMGYRYTHLIFTVLAVGELIADKLPFTPSRKAPPPFIARIVSGALTGATVGAVEHSLIVGLILGALGAVAGTLGGAFVRGRLAAAFKRDFPAALLEDIVTVALAIFFIQVLR